MRRSILIAVLLVLTAQIGHAAYRSGFVTLDLDLSSQDKTLETCLWVPYPVSDRYQKISEVIIRGDFKSSGVYTDGTTGAHILYAQWPAGAGSRKLQFTFAVTRQSVARRNFPELEPAWNPSDYVEYLRPNKLGPINGEVKKLSDTITAGSKTVIQKAKAIYDWTCENTYRDPKTVGCGQGDVCALLRVPGGKCTDISSVFIALCRAAGVPARELFSIRLGKQAVEDVTTWQHCWAEFFVPGYGWVPADPADVRKAMLVEKLDQKDPKTREYRNFFWGGIDPYRVVISSGRDRVPGCGVRTG
jgi:transglutaminase-like putative cysteine protease